MTGSSVSARPTPQAFFDSHPSKPFLSGLDHYQDLYEQSIAKPDQFFATQARDLLSWDRDFKTVHSGGFEHGDVSWFNEGQLNAAYNCVDRHAIKNPNKAAIVFEADEPADCRTLTYGELHREVSKVAAVLAEDFKVKKGEVVAVYMPMIPEAIIAILAVARVGAIHSVVFAGFSSGSLRDRVQNANSRVVLTVDEGKRGGKTVHAKQIVDDAINSVPEVEKVLVFQRTGNPDVPMTEGRDFYWHEMIANKRPVFPHVSVNSEDPLFLLYTSGSTGAPKGVVHATAGYLLGAALSTKYVFDVHEDDILFTAGDVGWITGHTYALYGPLMLGATTVVFEGTPAYPDYGRYWQIVEKHKATQFYVAPTALRLLKKAGADHIEKYDLSSLRTLGSVGEPIAPDLWEWYHKHVGREVCHISDTYWQTETGSHVIAPLAGVTPMKPGSATLPFFGIDLAIIDPVSGKEISGNDVEGVLAIKRPWPSMARSVWGAHVRYLDTYLKPYPGLYFTGDGAHRDADGYYWIRGRVDDVVNVSGHRLSTAEIEASLLSNPATAEAAVVGIADELTGQAVVAFASLKAEAEDLLAQKKSLIMHVRREIGPFAAPKTVIIVKDLPRTRSGKLMRRILRKIVSNEIDTIGDISTLINPQSVDDIILAAQQQLA